MVQPSGCFNIMPFNRQRALTEADPGAGARVPWPPPCRKKGPIFWPKHWYSMEKNPYFSPEKCSFWPKIGPIKTEMGPNIPICPVEGQLGAKWGPQGENCPHFLGSATPHEKSWIRPWLRIHFMTKVWSCHNTFITNRITTKVLFLNALCLISGLVFKNNICVTC